MFDTFTRHVNSAFSRGVGYERTPPGLFFNDSTVRGYFIDFRTKTQSVDTTGVSQLLPADLAQVALGWWERALAGEAAAMGKFSELCALLEQGAEVRGDEWWWPYDVAVRKYKVSAPTYSAMAQGQISSIFVRAYLVSGDPRHAELALAAARPLINERPAFVSRTPAGPVLEEIPTMPPSHILNGWIYSLWGLWDVAVGIHGEGAQAMCDASLNCLRQMLHRYDVGWWTRYSLYPHRLPDLAKPFYHRLHVEQVEVLYRLTGFAEFGSAARRWRSYDVRVHRMAAVAQKAAFVMSRYT